MKVLREKLAAIEHQRWADWQKWCHDILRKELNIGNNKNLQLEKVLERWDRQINTPYEKLSDAEKASDMEQVDRYWPLIEEYANYRSIEAKIDLISWCLSRTSMDELKRRMRELEKELDGLEEKFL